MKLADTAIDNKVFTLVLTVVILGAGVMAFQGMSRLEDPEFTIKDATRRDALPRRVGAGGRGGGHRLDRDRGAAARPARRDRVALRTRALDPHREHQGQVRQTHPAAGLGRAAPQGQRRPGRPAARGRPVGRDRRLRRRLRRLLHALGDEYSYAELKEVVELLRRELLLVDDVAKIDIHGQRIEAVYVEPDRERMAQLGVSPDIIVDELREKNLVADTGRVQVGPEFIAIDPTGEITAVEDFETVAERRQRPDLPPRRRDRPARLPRTAGQLIVFDGLRASPSASRPPRAAMSCAWAGPRPAPARARPPIPLGMEIGIVSHQSASVTKAIDGFVRSLVAGRADRHRVLLFFMGLRSGLLIGFVLVLTIMGSFVFLKPMGVALERISLGALIIALGMLVDNAIVVVDGILVGLKRGHRRGGRHRGRASPPCRCWAPPPSRSSPSPPSAPPTMPPASSAARSSRSSWSRSCSAGSPPSPSPRCSGIMFSNRPRATRGPTPIRTASTAVQRRFCEAASASAGSRSASSPCSSPPPSGASGS